MSYQDTIMAATGCTPKVAEELEEIMRDAIFCSTLDWQTRKELEDAARLALEAYNIMQAETKFKTQDSQEDPRQ